MTALPLRQLLQWYLDAGVDETTGYDALDFYEHAEKEAEKAKIAAAQMAAHAKKDTTQRAQGGAVIRRTVSAATIRGSSSSLQSSNTIEAGEEFVDPRHQAFCEQAASRAAEAKTLDELQQAISTFEGYPLHDSARGTSFSIGVRGAPVMIIGDAPDDSENAANSLFQGIAGQLLDNILCSIGLDREKNVYGTSLIPWPLLAKRQPGEKEAAVCKPFLCRHIELAQPRLLIVFGGGAASALLDQPPLIGQMRGRWFQWGSAQIPVMPTYSPLFLLSTPSHKRDVWRDMLKVQKKSEELNIFPH